MFYHFCRKKRTDYKKTVAASLITGLVSAAAVFFLTPKKGADNRKMAKKKFKKFKEAVMEAEKQAEGQVKDTSNQVKSRAHRVFENLKTVFNEDAETPKELSPKTAKKTLKKAVKKATKSVKKSSSKKDSDEMYS